MGWDGMGWDQCDVMGCDGMSCNEMGLGAIYHHGSPFDDSHVYTSLILLLSFMSITIHY